MSDTISRAKAIEALSTITVYKGSIPYNTAVMRIEQLPSAQPKRGRWILKSYRWECDQCGCLIRRANPFKGNEWNYNFCPNCGAKMEVTT